jgi:hypothetical protein
MRISGDMIRDQVRIIISMVKPHRNKSSNNSNKTLFQHTDHVNLSCFPQGACKKE